MTFNPVYIISQIKSILPLPFTFLVKKSGKNLPLKGGDSKSEILVVDRFTATLVEPN